MGNYPSEYYGATCKCGRSLPPCKTWSGFTEGYIDRKVDVVYAYTFHGGIYYRIRGYDTYYCNACFWEPKRREEQRLQEQRKREQRLQEQKEREQRLQEQRKREQRWQEQKNKGAEIASDSRTKKKRATEKGR
jgi:hypothetical protein